MPNTFDGLPIFGEGRIFYSKPTHNRWEEIEVLITVKATPQPSQRYGDTVCVAGIRMNESGPAWIRLYPVPFRSMEELDRFKKYEVLKLKVKPATDDFRPESFKPDRSSIQKVDYLEPWRSRHPWINPLVGEWSMCGILRANTELTSSGHPSLAAIRPKEIIDIVIEPHEGWSPEQQRKLTNNLQQDDLFGTSAPKKPLQAPRFIVKYKYRCEDKNCNTHTQSIIDWELSEFIRKRHQHDSDEITRAAIRARFFEQLASPDRGPIYSSETLWPNRRHSTS